jgi:hypothetical protein
MNRRIVFAALPLTSFAFSSRAASFVLVGVLVFAAGMQPQAHAITLNMTYFNEGDPVPHDENPNWDPAGTILKAHFQAAKTIWEYLLPGGGSYDFDFEWDDDISGLGLTTPGAFGDFIEINPNQNWFADPTPGDNAEFNPGVQSLYSGQSQRPIGIQPDDVLPRNRASGRAGSGIPSHRNRGPSGCWWVSRAKRDRFIEHCRSRDRSRPWNRRRRTG